MDEDFEAWIEKHAEELAREDAEANGTTFEEIIGINYEYDYIDDDEAFERDYEAYAEFEWVTPHSVGDVERSETEGTGAD